MNLQEIAIFKRFIGQHELRKNFIKKYKKSIGMTRNPESIEQYLSNVEPENAITSAVKHFIINEAMGYDFWQSVDISWQDYLHKMRSTHTIEHEEASTMRGYYSSLRENWDKDRPWVYEPIPIAQVRYGIITPEEAGLVNDNEEQLVKEEEQPVSEPEVKDEFEEFEFLDIQRINRIRKLGENSVSINTKENSYRLTLNSVVTKELTILGFSCVRIAKNKAGDVCLLFSRNDGCKARTSKSNLLVLSSKTHVLKIKELLRITEEYDQIFIKRNSVTANYVSYIIYK